MDLHPNGSMEAVMIHCCASSCDHQIASLTSRQRMELQCSVGVQTNAMHFFG